MHSIQEISSSSNNSGSLMKRLPPAVWRRVRDVVINSVPNLRLRRYPGLRPLTTEALSNVGCLKLKHVDLDPQEHVQFLGSTAESGSSSSPTHFTKSALSYMRPGNYLKYSLETRIWISQEDSTHMLAMSIPEENY